jgi:hypothetical protein
MAEGRDDEFGFVLHNLESGEDILCESESDALERTRFFGATGGYSPVTATGTCESVVVPFPSWP